MDLTSVAFLQSTFLPNRTRSTQSYSLKCEHHSHRQAQRSITTFEHDITISMSSMPCRRQFIALSGAVLGGVFIAAERAGADVPKTILDEEFELFNQRKKEAEEARTNALRASFDAVGKASEQLNELESMIDEGDWNGVRRFTRLFNNAVEREGMESISRKLESKEDREEGLKISKRTTDLLRKIDKSGKKKDQVEAHEGVAQVRTVLEEFLKLKPTVAGRGE